MKDVRTMSAAEINREFDSLDKKRTKLGDKFIAAGRGYETVNETMAKDDPLAREFQKLVNRRYELRNEVERRAGPGVRRLPRGFGPMRDKKRDCGCVMVHTHGRHRRAARDASGRLISDAEIRKLSADALTYLYNQGRASKKDVVAWVRLNAKLSGRIYRPNYRSGSVHDRLWLSREEKAEDRLYAKRGGYFKRDSSPRHAKFARVMREFRAGTLRTSAGKRVTSRLQAVAIALSEQRRADRKRTASTPRRDPNARSSEYRGFRIESFQGASARPATLAGLGRGEMTGGFRKERGYLIHLPDGGTKLVPTMKRAREYIDNYLG